MVYKSRASSGTQPAVPPLTPTSPPSSQTGALSNWRRLPEPMLQVAKVAVTISHAMLRAADSDDWSRVANLEHSRRQRLEEVFSAATAVDYDSLRDFVRLVQDLDARVLVKSRQRQKSLAEQMHDLRRGRRAKGAYERPL